MLEHLWLSHSCKNVFFFTFQKILYLFSQEMHGLLDLPYCPHFEKKKKKSVTLSSNGRKFIMNSGLIPQ